MYFLKYQKFDDDAPLQELFDSEKRALMRAFALISNLALHVRLEDETGATIVGKEEIRRKSIGAFLTPADDPRGIEE